MDLMSKGTEVYFNGSKWVVEVFYPYLNQVAISNFEFGTKLVRPEDIVTRAQIIKEFYS